MYICGNAVHVTFVVAVEPTDLNRGETQSYEEVCRPVGSDRDGSCDGSSGLVEQLSHEEPGDGSGSGGETDHEADYHGDVDVGQHGAGSLSY